MVLPQLKAGWTGYSEQREKPKHFAEILALKIGQSSGSADISAGLDMLLGGKITVGRRRCWSGNLGRTLRRSYEVANGVEGVQDCDGRTHYANWVATGRSWRKTEKASNFGRKRF